MTMNYAILALIGLLVLIAFSGCTIESGSSQEPITSESDAMNSMINVSNGVEDVGSALDNIDQLLG